MIAHGYALLLNLNTGRIKKFTFRDEYSFRHIDSTLEALRH